MRRYFRAVSSPLLLTIDTVGPPRAQRVRGRPDGSSSEGGGVQFPVSDRTRVLVVKYEYEHTPEHPQVAISHTHTYIKRSFIFYAQGQRAIMGDESMSMEAMGTTSLLHSSPSSTSSPPSALRSEAS